MQKIETIKLVNNSIISAIDKLNVKDGDRLIFYIRLDENTGDYKMPYDEVQRTYELIKNFLNLNYKNVDFIMIPDGVKYNGN